MNIVKINKLIAIGLVSMLALTGCTTGSTEASQANDGAAKYTIGISQFAEHPALDDTRRGFEDGLKELGVEAEIIYQNAQGDIPNTVSISQKFVKDEVDLIFAIATPPAQSAKQATTSIPILFSAVNDPVGAGIVEDWQNVGGNITGTSNKADAARQLKMFKEIDPSINTIGIIYNTSEANSLSQIEIVKELAPKEGLIVEIIGINNVSEISQALDSLLGKVDAVYGLSDNMVVSSVELVNKKLLDKNMISVGAEESQVNGGILITDGLSFYELGKQTARMAKEILVDGKDISSIPVEMAEKTEIKVNKNSLEALGLDRNHPLFEDAKMVGK